MFTAHALSHNVSAPSSVFTPEKSITRLFYFEELLSEAMCDRPADGPSHSLGQAVYLADEGQRPV